MYYIILNANRRTKKRGRPGNEASLQLIGCGRGWAAYLWHHMTDRGHAKMALLSEAEIFDACKGGDQDRVVRIISQGTDPRQVRNHDFLEETLLHTACRYVLS